MAYATSERACVKCVRLWSMVNCSSNLNEDVGDSGAGPNAGCAAKKSPIKAYPALSHLCATPGLHLQPKMGASRPPSRTSRLAKDTDQSLILPPRKKRGEGCTPERNVQQIQK